MTRHSNEEKTLLNFFDAIEEMKSRMELLEEILSGFDPYNNETIQINDALNTKIRKYRGFDDSE